MTVTMRNYGKLHGEPLYELTLTNRNGMQAKLLNYGATLEAVLAPDGTDLILSLQEPADYAKERNYLGGTVGRFAGRVPGNTWHLGERNIELTPNEGVNTIHGGDEGLDTQVFTATYQEEEGRAVARFVYLDAAGHNRLPGNVLVTVTYALDDENRLTYDVHAVSDALTLFNPTNHVYFALDGPDTTVADTTLQLASDFYAPLDARIPVNGWAPVADTPFDFRTGAKLGERIKQVQGGSGFDHPFLTKRAQAATLTGASGRKMTMTTTAPAVVVYTANHFDHTGLCAHIGAHAGVTLEAQQAPVSGQDWSAMALMPGQPYAQTTSWQFAF